MNQVRGSAFSQQNPDSAPGFNAPCAATDSLAAARRKSVRRLTRRRKHVNATIYLPVVLCLGLLRPASAAPGSWSQTADLPAPTAAPVACAVDGILYAIGGCYPYTSALATVRAYDPATDSWTVKAPLPQDRRLAAAAVVDGIIYVVGGSSGAWPGTFVLPVAAYNPKTDTWTNGANIPTPRMALAACAVDGVIYAIGGYVDPSHQAAGVEAYDPQRNLWTTRRSMPEAHGFLTASAVNGKIYVFSRTSTLAYNPQTDSWTKQTPLSPFSYSPMSSAVDGIIYLFGGCAADWLTPYDFAQAYDPARDRFTPRRKMPRTRLGAGCDVINGKIYLAGGGSGPVVFDPNAIYYTVVDVFDPQGGVMPQILSLACESANQVRLAWEGEAGIRYGVESSANAAGPWTRMMLPTGTSVLATNGLVETTCTVPAGEVKRFFRVLESN